MDQINEIWPKWHTVELIGRGAFGEVYKAKREELGETFYSAVKVIRIPRDESEVSEFLNEGQTSQSIRFYYESIARGLMNEIKVLEQLKSAGNVVNIEEFEIQERKDGIGWDAYIRMELLKNLNEYRKGRQMEWQEVEKLGMDICKALEYCEKCRIIHRDIKPSNIFVDAYGNFKLGDFGIARQMEKTQSTLSQKGTEMYMAPEVRFGDRRSSYNVDIYSLGLVMYRLLNRNRMPFEPLDRDMTYLDKEDALQRRLNGDPLPLPKDAPQELGRIIVRACEADKDKRYQSAGAMYADLVKWQRSREEEPERTEQAAPEEQTESKGNITEISEEEQRSDTLMLVNEEKQRTDIPMSVNEEKDEETVSAFSPERQKHSDTKPTAAPEKERGNQVFGRTPVQKAADAVRQAREEAPVRNTDKEEKATEEKPLQNLQTDTGIKTEEEKSKPGADAPKKRISAKAAKVILFFWLGIDIVNIFFAGNIQDFLRYLGFFPFDIDREILNEMNLLPVPVAVLLMMVAGIVLLYRKPLQKVIPICTTAGILSGFFSIGNIFITIIYMYNISVPLIFLSFVPCMGLIVGGNLCHISARCVFEEKYGSDSLKTVRLKIPVKIAKIEMLICIIISIINILMLENIYYFLHSALIMQTYSDTSHIILLIILVLIAGGTGTATAMIWKWDKKAGINLCTIVGTLTGFLFWGGVVESLSYNIIYDILGYGYFTLEVSIPCFTAAAAGFITNVCARRVYSEED